MPPTQEVKEMAKIDKILEPEVNEYIKACELSFAKYGDIFHAHEFQKTPSMPPTTEEKQLVVLAFTLLALMAGFAWVAWEVWPIY